MARDFTLLLREAIILHLKADAALTALLPESQIHGMRQPAQAVWPFTRYGSPDSRPVGLGEETSITLHVFSKDPSEDECVTIARALANALDGRKLDLDDDGDVFEARLEWRGTQTVPDAAEANAWHSLVRFEARIFVCA
jgi:hypothetical protein